MARFFGFYAGGNDDFSPAVNYTGCIYRRKRKGAVKITEEGAARDATE
jgi:hypothetical protein